MKNSILILLILLILSSCNLSQKETASIHEQSFLDNYKTINTEYRSEEGLNSCMNNQLNYCLKNVITEKSKNLGDSLKCNELSNENDKNECKSTVAYYKTIEEKEITKCDLLDSFKVLNCKYRIAYDNAVEKSDIKECSAIIENSDIDNTDKVIKDYTKSRENCINYVAFSIAFKNNDIKLCEKIIDTNLKNNCISQLEEFKRQSNKLNPITISSSSVNNINSTNNKIFDKSVEIIGTGSNQ